MANAKELALFRANLEFSFRQFKYSDCDKLMIRCPDCDCIIGNKELHNAGYLILCFCDCGRTIVYQEREVPSDPDANTNDEKACGIKPEEEPEDD